MPESKTNRSQKIPAPLNDIQVQALRNELFGHLSDRNRYIPLKPVRGVSNGIILEFRPRPTNS